MHALVLQAPYRLLESSARMKRAHGSGHAAIVTQGSNQLEVASCLDTLDQFQPFKEKNVPHHPQSIKRVIINSE